MQTQSSSQNYLPIQPWLILTTGFLIGQKTSQSPDAIDRFYFFVDNTLVPLYTTLVLAYLSILVCRTYILPLRPTSGRGVPPPKEELPAESESGVASPDEGAGEEQPIDMSGKYKLVSLENFDPFLEAQGVPWALRRAACSARPVHRIAHRGNRLTIRIEGIITTQTTYIIDGPPIEINIRGRIFEDRCTYLENGRGIRGIKKSVTENYNVIIDRVLSDDKQKITLTGRAVFNDGRETIESVQIFERIE